MSIKIPNIVKKYGGFLGKGLIGEFAPEVIRGALVEMFRIRNLDVEKAIYWVETNSSLWDSLEPQYRERFSHLAHKVGKLDWLTADWVIESIKMDFPAVASLFLGWEEGRNWLEKQINQIRNEVGE